MAAMDERGTALGFCDTKVKEGVGNKVPVTEAPETIEPETEAAVEAAVEAAGVPEAPEGVEAPEEEATLDEATS